MAKKPKRKIEKDNSERYLLTYADLMNLLLILFIVLYAMSQVDASKFSQLANSLRNTLGIGNQSSLVLSTGASNSLVNISGGGSAGAIIPSSVEDQQMNQAKATIDEILKSSNLTNQVSTSVGQRGVTISILSNYLFDSGSAELHGDVTALVQQLSKIFQQFPNNYIRVEGHTDSDPINTSQFPSNWELSSARAVNVLKLLINSAGVDSNHISAMGYGEYQATYPNDTPDNKAKNRRVDIVILKQDLSSSEPGGASVNTTAATPTTNNQ